MSWVAFEIVPSAFVPKGMAYTFGDRRVYIHPETAAGKTAEQIGALALVELPPIEPLRAKMPGEFMLSGVDEREIRAYAQEAEGEDDRLEDHWPEADDELGEAGA